MADSTVSDVSKMKVVELRKELKSRGLPNTGDKAELVARLQAAMASEEHGDINLDSDEIDSDGVLEDDDKSHTDILDDTGVSDLNEEFALSGRDSPDKPLEEKPLRNLKRKISATNKDKATESKNVENKEVGGKKIVLNRTISMTTTTKSEPDKTEEKPAETVKPSSERVKITVDFDAQSRLEMRAKRFGLPVKMSDEERKEARKQRFGQNTASAASITSSVPSGTLSENLEKLKKRAERFGQSVSAIMTDIEKKEKLEKRKEKFGTVK